MLARLLALALALSGCTQLPAQREEIHAALEGALRVRVEGPAVVRLAPRLTLQLQPGLAFVPPEEGARLLRALGKPARAALLGVVVADVPGGTEAAALYARGERPAGIAEIEVAGWEPAPALGPLAPRQ